MALPGMEGDFSSPPNYNPSIGGMQFRMPGTVTTPAGASNWDPQGTAYGIAYGNQMSPDLQASNLNRVADYANTYGGWGNPQAGQALASIAYAEGGANPFAINPVSGAQGMFQWLSPDRVANAGWALGQNAGPETQAQAAMSEINSGAYPAVYAALNNPNSSLPQMQKGLISQFENPNPVGMGAWNYAKYTPAYGDLQRAQQVPSWGGAVGASGQY